jgi:WD40 repeat protein
VAGGGRLLLAMACGDKVSGDTTVGVWDPLTGERVAGPLAGHTDAVRSVAFAPGPVAGGTGWPLLASASDDGTVRIWDPRAGAPVGHPIAAHTGGADAVAFGRGPDGRLLLASGGGDRAVRLWDPQTCEPASKPLTGHTGRVQSVALHTRGSRVVAASAGDDQTIRLWAPFSRRPARKTLTGHSGWVSSVAFGSVTRDGAAGEGRLLVFSGGGDRTVRVWDAASGACVVSLQRESIVRALAVSGRMVAVGQEEGFSVLELDRTVFR